MSQSPETALKVQRYEDGWEIINRMIREDMSWGGYERKCFHVQCGDGTFADISKASGVDFLDDGRGLCVGDFDLDGRPDLALRNRTAPQIRILRNTWPSPGEPIWIRCEGTESNRDAIGARITLRSGSLTRTKEVCAGSFFLSQSSRWLCFGLGSAPGPVRGEVRWPTGKTQDLGTLQTGRRYRVKEGEPPRVEARRSGSIAGAVPAIAGPADVARTSATPPTMSSVETWLVEPIPAPGFALEAIAPRSSAGTKILLPSPRVGAPGKPLWLHFISAHCAVCASEAEEARIAERAVAGAGGNAMHVLVDLELEAAEARRFADRCAFERPMVLADAPTLLAYNIVHRHVWSRRRDLAVPTSFLLDAESNIVKVYRGGVPASTLAVDLKKIPADTAGRLALALPLPGTLHRFSFHRDQLGLGNAFFEAGLFDLARETFGRSLSREGEDVDSLFNYAMACADSGRLEDAIRAYDRVLRVAPGLDDARNNLGIIQAKAGRKAEALTTFQSIVARNPAHSEAVMNLSNALVDARRAPEAVQVCLRALQMDPESAAFHRQLGYTQYQVGDRDTALLSYRKALEVDPADAEARLGLVILLYASGKAEESKKASLEGLARFPGHAGLWSALGMAQAALGEDDAATQSLEKAISADPLFDRAYTNLAKLLVSKGRAREAESVLRKLLEVAPDHPVATQMLEGLH